MLRCLAVLASLLIFCCCVEAFIRSYQPALTSGRLASVKIELDTELYYENALKSLRIGKWVKFISGASNQDLPLIRNLCFLYTLADVDCIDVSADPAVIAVAESGIHDALVCGNLKRQENTVSRPMLMISVNDDEDPHFRKASFDTTLCPLDCSRPCEKICPAWAIPPRNTESSDNGVVKDKCYGCGRCFSVCPLGIIEAVPHTVSTDQINSLLSMGTVDAIEIHTQPRHDYAFSSLWKKIEKTVLSHLKIVAVSFPDMGARTMPYLRSLQSTMASSRDYSSFLAKGGIHIWQADGRPMSGDISRGTAHAATELAARMLATETAELSHTCDRAIVPNKEINFAAQQHFIQLAGGTNNHSAVTAEQAGLTGAKGFGGFAFGGYARKHLNLLLNQLEEREPGAKVEMHNDVFQECLDFANTLVRTVKS